MCEDIGGVGHGLGKLNGGRSAGAQALTSGAEQNWRQPSNIPILVGSNSKRKDNREQLMNDGKRRNKGQEDGEGRQGAEESKGIEADDGRLIRERSPDLPKFSACAIQIRNPRLSPWDSNATASRQDAGCSFWNLVSVTPRWYLTNIFQIVSKAIHDCAGVEVENLT